MSSSPKKKKEKKKWAERRLRNLARTATDKIRAAELNKLAGAAGEKIRAEIRAATAASSSGGTATDDDGGQFITSYISSGAPRPSSSSSSMRRKEDNWTLNVEPESSSSSRARRPRPRPNAPSSGGQYDPNPKVASRQHQRRATPAGGGVSGPSSSGGVGGIGTRSYSSEYAAGRREQQARGDPLRRPRHLEAYDNFAYSDWDDKNDDDGMGRYGDEKMKKYFDKYHRRPTSAAAVESTANRVGDRRQRADRRAGQPQQQIPQTRDRRERERPKRDAESGGHHRTDKTGGGGKHRTAAPAASSRGGGRTRHDAANSGGDYDNTSVLGAVPTVTPFGSNVAAYQWDRAPLNESASREEKGSSTAAAEDYSLEDDDSHRQILDSVAYQWDRMPVPAGSSVIEDTNPTETDKQRHIPLGPDTGLQIGERNDFDRILQLLIKKMKLPNSL